MHWLPMEFSAGAVMLLGWFGFAGLVTSRGPMNSSRCKFWAWRVLAFARTGEAANPGPGVQWKVGMANLTGLTKKLDQVAQLDGDTWIFSDTHLTRESYGRFVKGLRSLKSPCVNSVPGAHCNPRMSDFSGEYSGVLMLSKGPARALVQNFDPSSLATGRILIGQVWVQAGMLYG